MQMRQLKIQLRHHIIQVLFSTFTKFIKLKFDYCIVGESAGEKEKCLENSFRDLTHQPLGSASSIIFWNDDQKKFTQNLKEMNHTILLGDYGSGKYTLHLRDENMLYIFSGKTELLEAAVDHFSVRPNTFIIFFVALGEIIKNSNLQ